MGDSATTAARAVFAGLLTADLIQRVDRVPASNEKVVSHEFLMAAGGPATNAAVAFAELGGAAELLSEVSDHPLASVLLDDLGECGVTVTRGDTQYAGAPIVAAIMVTQSTGDRAVVSPTSAAGEEAPELSTRRAAEIVRSAGAVLIDGYFRHLGLPVARAARDMGIPVVLDAGSHKPYTAALLAHTDVAIVSSDFAPANSASDPASVFNYLRGHSVGYSVITRGADPILYETPHGRGSVNVAPTTVVDTLGAGDFFHGALTYRLATCGLDEDRFPEDLAWASTVAGRSVGAFGTRSWLSRLD
jgi:sugar/nucleoside kinase (ribokinase family)